MRKKGICSHATRGRWKRIIKQPHGRILLLASKGDMVVGLWFLGRMRVCVGIGVSPFFVRHSSFVNSHEV
jgi:hypothetical protein